MRRYSSTRYLFVEPGLVRPTQELPDKPDTTQIQKLRYNDRISIDRDGKKLSGKIYQILVKKSCAVENESIVTIMLEDEKGNEHTIDFPVPGEYSHLGDFQDNQRISTPLEAIEAQKREISYDSTLNELQQLRIGDSLYTHDEEGPYPRGKITDLEIDRDDEAPNMSKLIIHAGRPGYIDTFVFPVPGEYQSIRDFQTGTERFPPFSVNNETDASKLENLGQGNQIYLDGRRGVITQITYDTTQITITARSFGTEETITKVVPYKDR